MAPQRPQQHLVRCCSPSSSLKQLARDLGRSSRTAPLDCRLGLDHFQLNVLGSAASRHLAGGGGGRRLEKACTEFAQNTVQSLQKMRKMTSRSSEEPSSAGLFVFS